MDLDEPVYTVPELAEKLKVDTDTIRRMFGREPGVLVLCFPSPGKRTYRTLRVPASVLARVLARFEYVAVPPRRAKPR